VPIAPARYALGDCKSFLWFYPDKSDKHPFMVTGACHRIVFELQRDLLSCGKCGEQRAELSFVHFRKFCPAIAQSRRASHTDELYLRTFHRGPRNEILDQTGTVVESGGVAKLRQKQASNNGKNSHITSKITAIKIP
jgi:hypothetical protein